MWLAHRTYIRPAGSNPNRSGARRELVWTGELRQNYLSHIPSLPKMVDEMIQNSKSMQFDPFSWSKGPSNQLPPHSICPLYRFLEPLSRQAPPRMVHGPPSSFHNLDFTQHVKICHPFKRYARRNLVAKNSRWLFIKIKITQNKKYNLTQIRKSNHARNRRLNHK